MLRPRSRQERCCWRFLRPCSARSQRPPAARTSISSTASPPDLRGRVSYRPTLLVKLILYAYCLDMTSSRKIERATDEPRKPSPAPRPR